MVGHLSYLVSLFVNDRESSVSPAESYKFIKNNNTWTASLPIWKFLDDVLFYWSYPLNVLLEEKFGLWICNKILGEINVTIFTS